MNLPVFVELQAVFEVPEELKLYVAPALETGNLTKTSSKSSSYRTSDSS